MREHSRTAVGWLGPMVRSRVGARARAERCYRHPGSPAAVAVEQLAQPAAKGAARQPTAVAAALAATIAAAERAAAAVRAAAAERAAKQQQLQQRIKGPNTVHRKIFT